MLGVFSRVLRAGLNTPGAIMSPRGPMILQQWNSFTSFTRGIVTQTTNAFPDVAGVFHHNVRAEKSDNPEDVAQSLTKIINAHPDSIFWLNEKSRILKKNLDTSIPAEYLPVSEEELRDQPQMMSLIDNGHLRPGGGHVAMGRTGNEGEILEDFTVSLRPGKKLIQARAVVHPVLYRAPLSVPLTSAIHKSMNDEIVALSSKMCIDPSIHADFVFIPLNKVLNHDQLFKNITTAQGIKLYTLCSAAVSKEVFDTITDPAQRKELEEMMARAKNFDPFGVEINPELEVLMAAVACTHAVTLATFGELAATEHSAGALDQTTQLVTTYAAIKLLGAPSFFDFAQKCGLYNSAAKAATRDFNPRHQ